MLMLLTVLLNLALVVPDSGAGFDYEAAARECVERTDYEQFGDDLFDGESGEMVARAERAALADRLATSDVADDHFARALLLDEPTEQFEALGRALEIDTTHGMAIAQAAVLCGSTQHAFCQTDWNKRYRQLEPTNLSPYLMLLAEVHQQDNWQAVAQTLDQAAGIATHYRLPWGEIIAMVANAAVVDGQSQFAEPEQAFVLGIGLAAGQAMPSYQSAIQSCSVQFHSAMTQGSAQDCAMIGAIMVDQSDSFIGEAIGASLALQLDEDGWEVTSADDVRHGDQMRQKMSAVSAESRLAHCLAGAAFHDPIGYVDDLVEVGEQQALARQNDKLWALLETRHRLTRRQLEAGEIELSGVLERIGSATASASLDSVAETSTDSAQSNSADRKHWWLWLGITLAVAFILAPFSLLRRTRRKGPGSVA